MLRGKLGLGISVGLDWQEVGIDRVWTDLLRRISHANPLIRSYSRGLRWQGRWRAWCRRSQLSGEAGLRLNIPDDNDANYLVLCRFRCTSLSSLLQVSAAVLLDCMRSACSWVLASGSG
jgi:hypothetical protein